MGIDIKTVSAPALDGIMRDRRPEGFYMALAEPRLLFWRACEVREGRVARFSGAFPAVIDWLFRRAGVLTRGTRVKNRVVGELNPWRTRVTMPGKTAVDAARILIGVFHAGDEDVRAHFRTADDGIVMVENAVVWAEWDGLRRDENETPR